MARFSSRQKISRRECPDRARPNAQADSPDRALALLAGSGLKSGATSKSSR